MATQRIQHLTSCRRVFRRYDPECPRCAQLALGAAPRPGYGPSRAERDRQAIADIRAHFTSA